MIAKIQLISAASLCLVLFIPVSLAGQTQQSNDEESSRQIVLDRFNKARPMSEASAGMGSVTSGMNAMKAPLYRRTGAARIGRRGARLPATEEIGITIWRLRPSRDGDQGGRVLVLDGLKQTQYTPERIEANTPLNVSDRVRITVESPRQGFLYIIDREQYQDGSFGEPMLIFPTMRTRGGDNRVMPGRLIDIPAQEDQYSYFTAAPAGSRRDQTAEVLTFMLVTAPLPLQIADQPIKLADQQVSGWEKLYGGAAETLELVGGAGRVWTNEEKMAGMANGRQLTQGGPPPQTVYRVARKTGAPLLVTVPLRYAR
jgi:hypothetical protein